MARKQPERPRVFCIGWHKTGTSTLGMALVKLGYSVVGARLDMVHPLRRGDINEVLDVAAQFDALQDVPWATLYAELDERFPDSRFILTVRDEQAWLRSALRHFGETDIPMHEWLYGDGQMAGNEAIYLERFRRHYADVKKYFKAREQDLLVLNLAAGEGWKEICQFLDQTVPGEPFPHTNKSPHSYNAKDKARAFLRSRVPLQIRRAVFATKLALRGLLGLPDPRNIFHNRAQNDREIRLAQKRRPSEHSVD